MNEFEALYSFFNSFDLPGYPSQGVPPKTEYPYLTYEAKMGLPFEGGVSCAVNIYYRTDSEAIPNIKAKEIVNKIGKGGLMVPYNGGSIWITTAEPAITPIADVNTSIKRRQVLLMLNYL